MLHELDGLRTYGFRREGSVIVLDVMAIDTTFEFDGFFFFLPTLTEGKKFFPTEFCTMNNSFLREPLKYTIECCLVHLARVNKLFF